MRRVGGGVGVTLLAETDIRSQTAVGAFDLMPGDYLLTVATTSGRCERAFTVPPDVAEVALEVELP